MITVICAQDELFSSKWYKGLQTLSGATPMYSLGSRAFDLEIFSSSLVSDDSFIVMYSDDVAALVPLYRFKGENDTYEYRYGGEYLRAPLIGYEKSSKVLSEVMKFVYDYIETMARKHQVINHMAMIESVELIQGRNYYNYLTDLGYVDESTICRLVDLTVDEDVLWGSVRKSYRSLINRAKKIFTYDVINSDNFNEEKCEEYRQLHEKAAGRKTRSLKSFVLMYEMVKNDQGFLILIKDHNKFAVAAHFFSCSSLYCLYFSSAIDDGSSRFGIGQWGVWLGIMTARKLGCHYLDMGQLRLTKNPSEKELNIAHFKKGFGGKTVTVFRGKKIFA